MRTIPSALSVIFVIIVIAANVTAKPPTVVYPTGIFPTDVQNVQAAINQGGTVLLKATDTVGHPLAFNFGAAAPFLGSGVDIANNVSISGELVGGVRTTISGGDRPFIIFGGKNSVSGLKFDGPFKGPILILGSAGTSIVGNEIQNIVPAHFVGFTLTDGIDVTGHNPADVSGNLVISNNTIGDLTGNFAIGIQVDSVAANVTISNNTFQLGQSVTDSGLNNSGAILCARCHSVVTISDNTITIGPGLVFQGIALGGGPDARYHVSGNNITSQSPLSDGIDVASATAFNGPTVAAVIEHNSITVHNAAFFGVGIGLFGAVSQSTIQGNILAGDTAVALVASMVFEEESDLAISNRFLFNDLARVTVSVSSVFFNTNAVNNIVRGQCVDVLDLGTGNDVSCPNPHSNVNSSAFSARQQMLQRALQSQGAVNAQANGAARP